MLTIPTADLHGCLSDVLPFISPDKDDLERRCVELRWDGKMFHAAALSGYHMGISSWSPDDGPDHDVQDALETQLGSDDNPWSGVLAVDDVKHMLGAIKPIKHLEYVPLFVTWDGQFLVVKRAKQFRVPGLTLAYDGQTHDFPDVRQMVVEAAGQVEPVKEISWNASLMADFGKVRSRGGAAKWTFCGDRADMVVEIGDRFVGALHPVRTAEDPS